MTLLDRNTLKEFFSTGKIPTQGNFENLIDSMINKLDDGFAKTADAGMQLAPELDSKRLVSFFDTTEKLKQNIPSWYIEMVNNADTNGLSITDASTNKSALFLQAGGNVGIGTTTPSATLEVNGIIASKGRRGGYADASVDQATVLADGKWHTIAGKLDGLQAFEVVASASGPKGQGNYAILHAIALSAYGDSKSRIHQTTARYKGIFRNIDLRWHGTLNSFALQIRTRKNFGKDIRIQFHLSQLLIP